jgi:ATP-dependent DNA helicase DinG
MSDRNDPDAEQEIVNHLVDLITWAEGRTLALFTNTSVMRRVHEAVRARVSTPVLVQGEKSRARLLTQFADDHSASLFAVASFWQGVDVPGESLSVVAIDRLPFRPQGDPISEARRSRSSSPFMEVDLPRATMMLAQGIGRLIRSANDRGVVAVFDTRLATARYANVMRKRIPPMARTRDPEQVQRFLTDILSS